MQPVYALNSRRLAGVELLARWKQEDGEVVEGEELIPTARAAGVLAELDREMLRQAAEYAERWGQGTVSVNLSQAFLQSDGAAGAVREVLRQHPAAGDYLTVEVTERTALDDSARSILREVTDAGLRLSLDDFGTGYASLSVLESLPVDEVKIDRSLVAQLGESERAENLTEGVLDLTHSVNAVVVAEGIEREAQLDWLAGHGCDRAQGFLLGRPSPPGDELPREIEATRREARR